jgi:hypothetical protein
MIKQNKAMTIGGWVITALIAVMLTFSASAKLRGVPEVVEPWEHFGYPMDVLIPIGITEIACVIVFLIPQTAVLGAVLLTGYLGGAVATHVRIHDTLGNSAGPVIGGVLVWLALVLRDPRVRDLLPIRRSMPNP